MKDIYYTIKNSIVWRYQKIRFGYSKRELWSLDHTITDFVLPRLKAFRHGESNNVTEGGPAGCPMLDGYDADKMGDAESDAMYQEWLDILDKMIQAFEYHKLGMTDVKTNSSLWIQGGDEYKEYRNEEERREQIIEEGLALFGKYYQALWD
tara:strand:- start:1995 stop:2447 length:453 start_codon:yes stop_codon:yes gene_type:complete